MATITRIRKNCMGTISFDAQFKGMRKPQDFIVYANPSKGRIPVQSDNRCGYIGEGGLITYATCPQFMLIGFGKKHAAQHDKIENVEELLEAIRGTASPMAGENGWVFCDNSTAANV